MTNIVINETSIIEGKSGQITGEIYFETSRGGFPEKNWNDFVVVVLSWWTNSLANLLLNDENETNFYFMDGPYRVFVAKSSDNMLKMQFCSDKTDGIFDTESISIITMQKILLKSCRKALRSISQMEISSAKIEGLKKSYDILKRIKLDHENDI